MDEKKQKLKENTRRWRARLKADPVRYEKYLAQQRLRANNALKKNPEVIRAKRRAYYARWKAKNPERYRDNYMRYVVKNRPEVNKRNLAAIERKFVERAGRPRADACEACGAKGKTVFDHDHRTNEFRGWICQNCNKALGFLRDNPAYIKALEGYIVRDFLKREYKKMGLDVEFVSTHRQTQEANLRKYFPNEAERIMNKIKAIEDSQKTLSTPS